MCVMNNNNCPACGSENTQRLEVACATNPNPVLLQSAAPPQLRRTPGATAAIFVAIIIGLLGFLLLMGSASSGQKPDIGLLVSGLIILGIACAIFFGASAAKAQAEKYNSEKLPPLIEAWKRRWICLKCGEIYEPRESVPDIRELNRA